MTTTPSADLALVFHIFILYNIFVTRKASGTVKGGDFIKCSRTANSSWKIFVRKDNFLIFSQKEI